MPSDIPKPFADQIARIPSCSPHKVRKPISHRCVSSARWLDGKMATLRVDRPRLGMHHAALLMVVIACVAITGCGSGGYAGGGITSLSSSAITIDAGQSIQISASLSGDEPVSWTMAGGSFGREIRGIEHAEVSAEAAGARGRHVLAGARERTDEDLSS